MSPQEFEAAYQRAMGLYALVKAKRAQVGERRKRKDGWYVKQADGWVKERGEAAAQPAPREQEPSERPAPREAPASHSRERSGGHVVAELYHDMNNHPDLAGYSAIPLSEQLEVQKAFNEAKFKVIRAIPFSHLRKLDEHDRKLLAAQIEHTFGTDQHKALLKRWDPHHPKVENRDLPSVAQHLVKLLHGHVEPMAEQGRRRRG